MNRKLLFYCIACLLMVLTSCKSRDNHHEMAGLSYDVFRKGNGRLPHRDDMVLFHFVAIDSEDSVWINTYIQGLPMSSLIADSGRIPHELSFKRLTRGLSTGDSLRIKFSKQEFYKQVLVRPDAASAGTIECTLSVDRIIPVEAYHTWMNILIAKKRNKRIKQQGKVIDSLLVAQGIKAVTDRSGVRYVLNQSKADEVHTGDTILLHHRGYLLNGTLFSASEPLNNHSEILNDIPSKFVVDTDNFSGISKSLKILGGKGGGIFYIPSPLLYGEAGHPPIVKSNEITYFELEIIDIKLGLRRKSEK